ncbi:hypothetical protein LINGRAPRIM_LOCUS350 [Linum grandiflorum]
MFHGECTVTPQDVANLTGLAVTGDALYVEYDKEMNWASLVEEVLGKGFMLADRSSAYVHFQYLLALRERRSFAWGASVLSWKYRELDRVTFKIESAPTSTSNGNIGAWMVLLQAWCMERFSSIGRRMHECGVRR